MEDAIIINQSFLKRLKNAFSMRAFNTTGTLTLTGVDWYDVEKDGDDNRFRWSHPKTRIEFENISALRIKLLCPIGREVHIFNDKINFKQKLSTNKPYTFVINTVGSMYLNIETEPYMPENDTRQLGLCFTQVCEHPSLSCL